MFSNRFCLYPLTKKICLVRACQSCLVLDVYDDDVFSIFVVFLTGPVADGTGVAPRTPHCITDVTSAETERSCALSSPSVVICHLLISLLSLLL